MATFLDYRLSENSSTFGFPNISMSQSSTSPSNIGSIGLIVGNNSNLRVDLSGEIGVQTASSSSLVVITIVRNAPNPTSPSGGTTTYNAFYQIPANTTITIGIHDVDFNPPANPFVPGQLTYSLFAQSSGGTVIRTGPENFSGFAVTG